MPPMPHRQSETQIPTIRFHQQLWQILYSGNRFVRNVGSRHSGWEAIREVYSFHSTDVVGLSDDDLFLLIKTVSESDGDPTRVNRSDTAIIKSYMLSPDSTEQILFCSLVRFMKFAEAQLLGPFVPEKIMPVCNSNKSQSEGISFQGVEGELCRGLEAGAFRHEKRWEEDGQALLTLRQELERRTQSANRQLATNSTDPQATNEVNCVPACCV